MSALASLTPSPSPSSAQESLGEGVPWPGLDVVLHRLGGP